LIGARTALAERQQIELTIFILIHVKHHFRGRQRIERLVA
jgi:hypothetical protein